ncbi:hypothetical protein K2X05_07830 [bacterium]|nr:hypothetical protein [bacterium]
MSLALIINMLFFSSTIFADSCQCPVIQCDPCQRPLRLGTEMLACGYTGKMECDKVVCENVDNYFQCLAGEPAIYVPPQNLMTRITEPLDPADKKPQPIDFNKLAEKVEIKEIAQDVFLEPKPSVPKEKISVRKPASVEIKEKPIFFSVVNTAGKTLLNKKPLKKKITLAVPFELNAKEKNQVTIKNQSSHVVINMSAQTSLKIRAEEDVVWFEMQKGDAVFKIKDSQWVHAVDMGQWRFGKKSGSFGLSRTGELYTLLNEDEEGFLRRNELISNVQKIPPKKMIQMTVQDGIFAFRDTQVAKIKKPTYQMSPMMASADARSVASEKTLCAAPEASFESCAWKCFGARAKDKKCGQSKNSQCVRFTCSADGLWKLPTMASGSECSADVVRVGSCQ